MPRRARRHLKGPRVTVLALLAGVAACGRAGDAPSPAAPAASPEPPPARSAPHAACTAAPLTVHVDTIRRQGADSLRVELTLARLATGQGAGPDGVEAALRRALDDMSLVTADGRRRLFPLRSSSGDRVGPPVEAPPPGGSRAFWALFPAAEGPLTVLLPGCAPLTGLAVAPGLGPGRPEP
jgi:hypothetical protein